MLVLNFVQQPCQTQPGQTRKEKHMLRSGLKNLVQGASCGVAMAVLAAGAVEAEQSALAEIEAVSDAFYAALNEMLAGSPISQDVAPLWLDAEGVTALHPVGGRDIGLSRLVAAFDGVASLASGGAVALQDQAIAVFGETAVETGIEIGSATLAGEVITLEYRVTNVYILSDEGWRMVHHHTDLSTPIIELLARLSD